jgi:hypothetical protein
MEWGGAFRQDGKLAWLGETLLELIRILVPILGHGIGGEGMDAIGKEKCLAGLF